MSNSYLKNNKIVRFINFISNNVVLAIQKAITELKLAHDKLKQYDEKTGTVPYYEMYVWVTEVLGFGFLLTIVYINIFIFTGWLQVICFIFSLGVIRWLWLDFVENTSNAIRGKK